MTISRKKEITEFLKSKNYDIKISPSDFDTLLQILDDFENRNISKEIVVKKTLLDRKMEFGARVGEHIGKITKNGEFLRDDALDFYNHWTETSPNQTKMPFEKKTSFDIGKRIGTWMSNKSKFSQKDNGKSNIDDIYNNILGTNSQQQQLL